MLFVMLAAYLEETIPHLSGDSLDVGENKARFVIDPQVLDNIFRGEPLIFRGES